MSWLLIISLTAGALWLGLAWQRTRREAARLEEENMRLEQDRRCLLEFMHLMAEGLGE